MGKKKKKKVWPNLGTNVTHIPGSSFLPPLRIEPDTSDTTDQWSTDTTKGLTHLPRQTERHAMHLTTHYNMYKT